MNGVVVIELEQRDQSVIDAENAVFDKSSKKRNGEVYADTGVTVSFTSDDAMALLQVKAAFELGATSTVIEFSNGQKLPMTADKFLAFAGWFTAKRNAFFQ